MTLRGLFAGALALIALEAVVRSEESASRFGGLFTGLADLVSSAMSPSVPLVPDLAGVGTAPYGSGGGSQPRGGGNGGGGSW